MDQLAEVLEVVDGRQKFQPLLSNRSLAIIYNNFISLADDADETRIEANAFMVISQVAGLLKVCCFPNGKKTFGVGGMLADQDYAVRGVTDTFFQDMLTNKGILVVEITSATVRDI